MIKERFTLHGNSGPFYLTVGLEVHAQIVSNSKLFSPSSTAFGGQPNTQVDYFDAGFPGMLPVLNEKCIEQAVKTSLGLGGKIHLFSRFDRKNYFYPDLPSGYQITQFFHPLMLGGRLEILDDTGKTKEIRINRLHVEQDAGKSLHDQVPDYTVIDLNRAGVGLMEIVSEPDLTSPDEAVAFVKKLRNLLICLGTCDGNMEQGNLRVDANVSVARPGRPLGTRAEIKNLNSFRFLHKAILVEGGRQIELIEQGQPVLQQTRSFDPASETTATLRDKEDAHEYRYFPDPDLPPVILDEAWVESIKQKLPEFPDAKKHRFMETLGLKAYDADVLTADYEVAAFFEETLGACEKASAKLVVNWLMGDVMAAFNKEEGTASISDLPFKPVHLAELVDLIASDVISGKIAKSVFKESWETGRTPRCVVDEKGLRQVSDPDILRPQIQQLLEDEKDMVEAYRSGKDKLFGYFVGQVMKRTGGKASPELVNTLLRELLNQ
jgi:aspartyl-tRNA(Asn)/glutamyl-tRNA(Gln) amidotransferase subunit B